MQTKSEDVAAIVAELEQENASLRQTLERLRNVIDAGFTAGAVSNAHILVPLPTPKELAFGQRWAIVFTITPNNTRRPSLDDLYCPITTPDGSNNSYMPMNATFGQDELPELAFYLGMASAAEKG